MSHAKALQGDDSDSRLGAVQASFLFSTHSHVASRGSGGGATVAMPTRSDAGYGPAHLQRITRCPQQQSGHRRGCQVLRCWRTPHNRPQANCFRPRCISRCGKRLFIRLEVLEYSLTPWAPRSDLHHRSGQLAPVSVCVLPHLRLAQLVESPASGDDPRRIRERTAS